MSTSHTDDYVARRMAGLPAVLAIPHELVTALEGRPIVVLMVRPDGTSEEVVLRLPTVEEFMDGHQRACKEINVPSTLSESQAAALVKPMIFPTNTP